MHRLNCYQHLKDCQAHSNSKKGRTGLDTSICSFPAASSPKSASSPAEKMRENAVTSSMDGEPNGSSSCAPAAHSNWNYI